MARTALTVSELSYEGVAVSAEALTAEIVEGGSEVENDPEGRVFILVINGAEGELDNVVVGVATTRTVTEPSGTALAVADSEVTVGPGETAVIGPWSDNFETSSGKVEIDWALEGEAAADDVGVAAFKIG